MTQVVGLLLLFSLTTVINACKQTAQKSEPEPIQVEDRDEKISYVENDNFFIQFPETSGEAMIELPTEIFDLPLIIHLAPSLVRKFGDSTGVTEARKVMSKVKQFFLHSSLKIKFFLTFDDSSFILNDKEVEVTDQGLSELANHISPPVTGRAAIVYLSASKKEGLLGIANQLSICDTNRKLSRSIVRWKGSTTATALIVAHEIGHTLGFYHDFDKYPKVRTSKRNSTCGPEKYSGGENNNIMNYGWPMQSSWSACTNQDLLSFYEIVVSNDGSFCLEKREELLFLDPSRVYHLPSFLPATTCQIPPHPTPGLWAAVAGQVDGSLLICGGRDIDYNTQSACHKLTGIGWEMIGSLEDPTRWAAASSYHDQLLVTGGKRVRGEWLTDTQMYQDNAWTRLADLPLRLCCHCQVFANGTAIITGGWTGTKLYSSVLKLVSGRWVDMPAMRTARWFHSCAVLSEELYVLGGVTHTVEIFSFNTNTWRYGLSLPNSVASNYSQAVVTSNQLYFVSNDGQVLKMAEKKWEKVINISGSGARYVFPALLLSRKELRC